MRGLWVAMATPLDAEGHVDHTLLARHGLWLLEQGCDGLVPFGTTGEGPSFSGAERIAAAEALLRAGVPAARIGLGTGCPAIPDTVAMTREALSLGMTYALILPPYFFRDADDQGIEDAFSAVIDGVGSDRLRATLYHIPQVSGVPVPAAVFGRLRKRYGELVAGVKDSTGEFAQFRAFRAAAPDAATLVGAEFDIARALAEGGAGSICAMVNIVPRLVRAMFDGPAGEPAMRAAIALMTGPFQATLKSVLAAQTGDAAWRTMRAPLRAVEPGVGTRIAASLAAIGKVKAA